MSRAALKLPAGEDTAVRERRMITHPRLEDADEINALSHGGLSESRTGDGSEAWGASTSETSPSSTSSS